MRLNWKSWMGAFATVALAAPLMVSAAAPAAAGGLYDRVYADSFGNLVIRSPSGYKRIVVGQGHLAKELGEYSRAGAGPDVVYYDEADRVRRDCRRHGVLLKGRGYMYGLPDNTVPVLVGPCR
ncbi:hypothetical protein GN330_04560 [Nitratireductor sp. CAU 1489]|uniref:Uncharacterized protein n=1 Tax=Nitratireductor arenosus TaxID=2682096 RepID=A0A844QFF9_9HYPH|nr:hypothetical protein [Nitratireductor arenosus]MVA96519.1 hypothetical protein [Nitratireductor arenosus]